MDVFAFLSALTNYMSTSVPPGPKMLQIKHVVNFQKGGTIIYVLMLMYYFDCYNKTAYTYLALHGSYGLLWLLKDQIFPDKKWKEGITCVSSILCFVTVLGPYWISAYLIISNHIDISNVRISFCIMLHTFGCVIMMASDTQKYFELKTKKLINDGWFKFSRNSNYLGEMMIYLTYALLGNSALPYLVLLFVWTALFYVNMNMKDRRIKRKKGGSKYIQSSNMLIPFRFISEILMKKNLRPNKTI